MNTSIIEGKMNQLTHWLITEQVFDAAFSMAMAVFVMLAAYVVAGWVQKDEKLNK